MKKGVISFVLLMIVFFFFMSQVSADFTLGNKSYSIDANYAPGDKLNGWINISLQREPADSLLATNFGSSMKIVDFLDRNSQYYSCFPSGCGGDYFLTNGQDSSTFSMNSGEEKTVAFNASGKVAKLLNFSLGVNIDNPPSCFNPVEIVMLNTTLWKSWKFDDSFTCTYANGMGCFNYADSSSEKNITTTSYCENIDLIASGKFRLGAWLRKIGSGKLTMELFGTGGGSALASCDILESEVNSSGGEVSCIINYNNTRIQEYFVCIRSAVTNSYSIKTESVNPCGFFAINLPPSASQQRDDYSIFAKGAMFSKIGSFNINQKEYEKKENSGELVSNIENNIRERYDAECGSCSINCTESGCKIPMKIKSFGNFNITLSNLNLQYQTEGGDSSSNRIYNASLQQSKINSDFLVLDLDYANFSVPSSGYGNISLSISLGGQDMLYKQISIAKIPVIRGISPRAVPAGVSSKFTADVYSPANNSITEYSWNFGDEIVEDATINSITHAYTVTGVYTLSVYVKDSQGFEASKEFSVVVGSARNIANSTIKKYRARLNNLTSQIGAEPEWIKKILKEKIEVDDMDLELKSLEKKFSVASSDDEFTDVMMNLSEMNIPSQIKKGGVTSFPVLIDPDEINLDYLSQMGAGDIENLSEEESAAYKEALISWYDGNAEMNLDFYTLSAYYDTGIVPILNYYNLKITAKNPNDNEAYLIIGDVAVFAGESPKELESASGVDMPKLEDRNIEFAVVGDKNPLELAIYISPEFKKLDVKPVFINCNSNKICEKDLGEDWKSCREDCKPWGWAVFYLILLIILAFVIYIILQEWYKRKYESYLFKSRNELYNIVNFINNALSRGMQKQEIEKNLKKAGWSSEQISYAFKKVGGKRAGMPVEIGFSLKKGEKEKLSK